MDQEPLRHLLRSLRCHADVPGKAPLSDAELVQRFAMRRDEAAFELLLWRHGPAVLGVCRRLLANSADVEDAFQATFLTLARKVGSLREPGAVGGWLYRIAYRVALRAREEVARRARREGSGVDRVAEPFSDAVGNADLRAVLDEEVNGLPQRCQAAFVLCCVEGMTTEEAARHLGCPPGTVSSRVTRARQQLRRRLARRGLAPTAVVLAAALADSASAVSLPAPIVVSTVSAALQFAAGGAVEGTLSPRAVYLAQGVLRAMLINKCRSAGLIVLVVGLLAFGGMLTHHLLQAATPDVNANARVEKPSHGEGNETESKPLAVRVLKPVAGPLERAWVEGCVVQPAERQEVFAVVPGVLKTQFVDIGSLVKQGQTLAEIDAPLLQLAEKQAAIAVQQAKGELQEGQARLQAAKAEVQAAQGTIAQRQAEVEAAHANSKTRENLLMQMQKLHESGTLPANVLIEKEADAAAGRAQITAAKGAVEKAKSDLELARSHVALAEAALLSARAVVENAEIALEKARFTLQQTHVVAPVDGVVTRRNFATGTYVRSVEQGEPQPLFIIERTDSLRVVVQVKANAVPFVEAGTPVVLSFDTLGGMRLTGYKITRTAFAADPKTGFMRVEIDLPNPKQLLRPGTGGVAWMHITKGSPQSLWVEGSSVTTTAQGEASEVYVVRDGKAHRTPVRIGAILNHSVEILSGLRPTDSVVIDGEKLKGDNVPVEAKE